MCTKFVPLVTVSFYTTSRNWQYFDQITFYMLKPFNNSLFLQKKLIVIKNELHKTNGIDDDINFDDDVPSL